MLSIVNTGGSGSAYNFNYAKTINVGPSREFQRIYDAVASLKNQPVLGMVLIQVDDGTYNEPVLYFNDPYWSGKLVILGDVESPSNCVINTIPDPELSFKITPGTFIGQPDLTNQTVYGADYSKVSFGFLTDNGFVLRLGGFTINGQLNDASAPQDPYAEASASPNVTKGGLFASNKSKILCADNSIIVNDAMYAVAATTQSTIFCKGLTANNCNRGAYSSTRSIVVVTQMSYTGYSNGSLTTTDPVVNNFTTPASVTTSNYGVGADNGGILYAQYSTITNAYNGVVANTKAYIHCSNSSFNSISSSVFIAVSNGCILGSYSTLNSTGMANATVNSYIEVVSLLGSGSISGTMAATSNSFINASNCGVLQSNYPSVFSGITSNAKNSAGGSVLFSLPPA